MRERRSYDQYCGLARALDVLGERWTLLLVRELLLGPRRYTDLLRSNPGLTTNLLARRLAELEAAGVVTRAASPPPTPAALYALTDAGRALEPAVLALASWGGRFLDGPKVADRVDLGWALLSSKRRYQGGAHLVARIEADGRTFTVALDGPHIAVCERAPDRADIVVRGTTDGVLRLLFRREDPAVLAGQVEVEGDVEALRAAFVPPA